MIKDPPRWFRHLPEGFAESHVGASLIELLSAPAEPFGTVDSDHPVETFRFPESNVSVIGKTEWRGNNGDGSMVLLVSSVSSNSSLVPDSFLCRISSDEARSSLAAFMADGGSASLWAVASNWVLYGATVFRKGFRDPDPILLSTMIGCLNRHAPLSWNAACAKAEAGFLLEDCNEVHLKPRNKRI